MQLRRKMLKNTSDSYGWGARLFHWTMFLIIAGLIIGGNIISDMPAGPDKTTLLGMHKSFGVVILFLAMCRLIWRLSNERPQDLGKNPLENKLGHAMHIFLYVLILEQPVIGILMSQSLGYPVNFFNMATLPTFVEKNAQRATTLLNLHSATGGVLAVAVTLHAAAALKHHFIEKDRTLLRMMLGK